MKPRILAFVPTLGLVSETFITDALMGLATAGADLIVAAGAIGDPNLAAELRVVKAPFLHLSRLIDRVAAHLVRSPSWSGDRDTLLDRNATRVVATLVAETRPTVAYIEYGFNLARLARPLSSSGVPFIARLHGHDVTAALIDSGYRAALAAGLAEATMVVVASNHMRRLAVLAGAPMERVAVVPLGIDLKGIEPRSWEERRRRAPRIAFLGRLVAKKHPVALVEAFAIVASARPDVTLDIIGEGPERGPATARAIARGVSDRVRFHGALPRERALSIIREATVYAQHSVTSFTGDQEGFGISIAEAAALGLPVVATRHNGIPEQVIDNETGLLVPEYDFEAMAAAILSLLADPDRCAKFGAAGQARVVSGWRPAAQTERLNALLIAAARNLS